MKTAGIFLAMVLTTAICRAEKDFPDCEKTYFTSGQLSTQKCYDKAHRSGKAYAYNKKGKVIYEKDLRAFAGHASVYFTFHPNGAVKRADWSSAPDAGIQWYSSRDEFSEDGNLIYHTVQNYDDYIQLRAPLYDKRKDTEIIVKPGKNDTIITDKKKVETWFINHTWYPVTVIAISKTTQKEVSEEKIMPGDSVSIVSYDFSTKNNEPSRKYKFELIPYTTNSQLKPVVKSIRRKIKPNKNVVYYYTVENKSKPD